MVESANFDGTSDYMTIASALSGVSNSKTGIMSFWHKPAGAGTARTIYACSPPVDAFNVILQATDLIQVAGANGSTTVLGFSTATSSLSAGSWHHVLFSWDLSSATLNSYVDDASSIQGSPTLTNSAIAYASQTEVVFGNSGSNKPNGDFAEFYFAPGQYLDFSVVSNRRKFITSSLKPVYLGTDGAGPTGAAPSIYLHLDPGETVADFAMNRGTGGDFTITGALAAGSTSPSDF